MQVKIRDGSTPWLAHNRVLMCSGIKRNVVICGGGEGKKNYKASLRACLVIISFRWKNTNATQEAASCSRQPPSDIWMGGRLMVEELKETTLQTKWVGKSLHRSSCITDSQEPTNHNTFTGQNLVKKKKKIAIWTILCSTVGHIL